MSTGYNMTPTGSGGFTPVRPSANGAVPFQDIPFSSGRSLIANIPEFQREGALDKYLLTTIIKEGRANFTKYLYEYAEMNGKFMQKDVKYRWQVEVVPHQRFYLAPATYAVTSGYSTFKLNSTTKPSSVNGSTNPNVIGELARLEVGQLLLVMCSFTNKGRTATATVHTDVAAAAVYTYNGKPTAKYPIPEIVEITGIDYSTGDITVLRNWAGKQRTSTPATLAETIIVASVDTAPTADLTVRKSDAFFIALPKSMPEDEIDAKIVNYTTTWAENFMQRGVKAWGSGKFSEILNRNFGIESRGAQSKRLAIEAYYNEIAWDAMWGEKQEGWTSENYWWGRTDGLLANISSDHYIGLAPMNVSILRSKPENAYGSFDIPVFNKLMEEKGYYGSDHKVMLCGASAYGQFSTMINQMTQSVPDIKSDWKVVGKSFQTSNGLTVDFIPNDLFSLNGMSNYMVMLDPSQFLMGGLEGYPTDIIEDVNNVNPNKHNGFIQGVHTFMDKNPDAHWVFILDDKFKGTSSTAASNVLGIAHSSY